MISTFDELGGKTQRIRRLVDPKDKTWSAFNPSVGVAPNGSMAVAIRSSNYVILPHGALHVTNGGPIRNQVWFGEFTDSFEIQNLRKLDFSAAGIKVERGVEDPKLLWRDGRWMFMGVFLEREVPVARNCCCYMDRDYTAVEKIEILPGFSKNVPEKNWMSASEKPKKFDYVYNGSAVVSNNRVVYRLTDANIPGKLRGNANLILQSDGTYLGIMHVLHTKTMRNFTPTTFGYVDRVEKIYDHYLVRFDDEGYVIEISEPFYFDMRAIEFVNGFAERGDEFLISYGRMDQSSYVATIPRKSFLKILKKLPT